MAQGFLTSVDIVNRGLQHIGARRISTLADVTRNAAESLVLYDKIRRAELRRSVWNFSCRRAALRPLFATATTNVVPIAWSNLTTYGLWAAILDTNNQIWISRQAANLGNSPVEGVWWTAYTGPVIADTWSFTTTYYPGELVTNGGIVYIGLNSATPNLNHIPPNATYWAVFTSTYTTPAFYLPSPLNLSPDFLTVRNVYRLPYGFLRIAPQDPKQADLPRLGVSAEMRYRDWELENGFLFSKDTSGAFVFRYVADITDVTLMDDLFCEAVSARIGLELCEMLTQNRDKLAAIRDIYATNMQLAKDINAVEMGSTENEEDPDARLAPPQPAPPRGQ